MNAGQGALDPAHSAADAVVVFSISRAPLRVSERIAWRLSLIVLVLSKCRGQAASAQTLHNLSWALQNSATRALARQWWESPESADLATMRTDPRLATTITIAAAEDLLAIAPSGRVELTDRGREFGAMIDSDESLMSQEKALLRDLAPLNDRQVMLRLGGM
ncbi:hypothetical protein CSO01_02450 [Cellulomonas soli]|uniref:Uncharacterized protein n=1 Tax=Cellulomonas soli TaxID=931535 RepID=A0A512P8L7_9CELL|nr:hypothetical protein CSO01_02450 [Cellulomonas soli]